jgi:CheY-like chemotaxis protein
LILPGINGFEVLSQIKAAATTANIPVIILSNLSAQSALDKANALGVDKFIVKPSASLENILKNINDLISIKS